MAKTTKGTALLSTGEIWELGENATMRLPRSRFPTVVYVERGTVLVTQEGDLEDHVLGTGDTVVLPVGGLAVAWAFTEAVISQREVFVVVDPSLPVSERSGSAPRGRGVLFRRRRNTQKLAA
jgi:hypothetical protein